MQPIDSVKKRLATFLDYLNISQGEFAKKIGVSRGFANNIGDSIRKNTLDKILNVYPELNTTWLLTGEGDMLKGETPKKQDNDEKNTDRNINIHVDVLKTMDSLAASVNSLLESLKTRDRQIERMLAMLESWQQRAFSCDLAASVGRVDKLDFKNPPPHKNPRKIMYISELDSVCLYDEYKCTS